MVEGRLVREEKNPFSRYCSCRSYPHLLRYQCTFDQGASSLDCFLPSSLILSPVIMSFFLEFLGNDLDNIHEKDVIFLFFLCLYVDMLLGECDWMKVVGAVEIGIGSYLGSLLFHSICLLQVGILLSFFF